tara:strand:+ start:850 stop:2724 length:1875 start_codon:yes stop_codon:yes gene_type:complete
MCGICGYWTPQIEDSGYTIYKMLSTLQERGPDSSGHWEDKDKGITIGHSRLAVLDISDLGRQPMSSVNGRYLISYNGEIYNHNDIRKQLQKEKYQIKWKSNSDTETILEAISYWGLDSALKKFIGMFSFCLWDKYEKKLSLVRDRMGEKPLFYFKKNNTLIFGSELRTLEIHPGFLDRISQLNLSEYLNYGYISKENTIYQISKQIEPGGILEIQYDKEFVISNRSYWSVSHEINNSINQFTGNKKEAISELESLLIKAINGQMIADVPIGAFLSGGIDSSCIVALMQKINNKKINTFTLGFEEEEFDESENARKISNYLGTNHTELKVKANDVKDIIPKVSSMFDGPFGDISMIPTYMISSLARKNVTVALSGDGGDELFAGYNRYKRVSNIHSWVRFMPEESKRIIEFIEKRFINSSNSKIKKLINLIIRNNPYEFYEEYMRLFSGENILKASNKYNSLIRSVDNPIETKDIINQAIYSDIINYLPSDILTKVDRMAMRSSLETRIPFLDHRIVEFCFTLPLDYKIMGKNQKIILKELVHKYIPKNLLDNKKKGFSFPVGKWLRGPLKDWGNSLLNKRIIESDGILNEDKISLLWDDHQNHKKDNSYKLWNILMLQSWLHRK